MQFYLITWVYFLIALPFAFIPQRRFTTIKMNVYWNWVTNIVQMCIFFYINIFRSLKKDKNSLFCGPNRKRNNNLQLPACSCCFLNLHPLLLTLMRQSLPVSFSLSWKVCFLFLRCCWTEWWPRLKAMKSVSWRNFTLCSARASTGTDETTTKLHLSRLALHCTSETI